MSLPNSFASSSYKILTIWSFLDKPGGGFSFNERFSIFLVISNTNFTLTSDCNNERWISFDNSLMSSSSTPEELTNFLIAALRLDLRLSSIGI